MNNTEQKRQSSKFFYASGLNMSTAKRLCKWYFNDFFFKLSQNNKERRYECYLKDKIGTNDGTIYISKEDIQDFQKEWGITCIIIDTKSFSEL